MSILPLIISLITIYFPAMILLKLPFMSKSSYIFYYMSYYVATLEVTILTEDKAEVGLLTLGAL